VQKSGKLIVIEGTDGSGKTVQSRLLAKNLKQSGYVVKNIKFPRYAEPSAYFVNQYLNGAYGSGEQVDPKAASMFYALDRFAAKAEISKALAAGKIVLVDRYVASNMAHQGGKINGKNARSEFFKWVAELEFKTLGIPRPNLNIILHAPAELAQKMVDKKRDKRAYLKTGKRDIHEDDLSHLKNAEACYLQMAKEFPQFFELIECAESGELKEASGIAQLVWQKVAARLKP